MRYEEWCERIRADNPDMDEYHVRVNARTVARLARQNAADRRNNPPKAVRLVPLAQPTGFINALYGAVDTTGRMPVVRPKQEEEAG